MNSMKALSALLIILIVSLAAAISSPSFKRSPTVTPITGTTALEEAKKVIRATAGGQNKLDDSSRVVYFSSQEVMSAFTKPGNGFNVLYSGKGPETPFEIRADRREGPGTANVHALLTEVYFVEAGTATYVSSGKILNPKTTAPNEIRGDGIEGGESREISKGDVVVVPRGVPHWFKDAKGPFFYYLVRMQ